MKNPRVGVVASILFLAAVISMRADPLQSGQDLLARATDQFYSETVPREEVAATLDRARTALTGVGDLCERAYWVARVGYLQGFVERALQRVKSAEGQFDMALELAEQALACSGSSDAHRLVADITAQLIPFHGTFYAMRHGPRIMELAEKAVELDPSNARARMTLALSYLNAPRIGGGSVERATQELLGILSMPLNREETFGVLTWLGLAYEKSGDPVKKRVYLMQAAEVYPNNSWIPELLDEE